MTDFHGVLRIEADEGSGLVNPEAYEAYLEGRFHWAKRRESDLRKAIEYFQRAVEKDPNYALPYDGLADSYLMLA